MAIDIADAESRLWAAADKLWANTGLKPSEFSTPVLGLIFLRYSETRFVEVQRKYKAKGTKVEDIEKYDYQAEGVMFLPEKARFSTLLKLAEADNLGKALNDAMAAIEAENEDLKGVLPRAYTRIENWVLVELLRLLAPVEIEGDAFGQIYEYFLGNFALKEGQKGGVFYTPTSIVKLIVEIIEPFHGRIFDPACGSGGMFVQSAMFVKNHRKRAVDELTVFGTEKDEATVKLAKMNLAVHGLYRIGGMPHSDPLINLSEIDFAALQKKFADGEKHSEAEKLKRLIAFNLARLVTANRSRIDFMEKFQQLIDEYNTGSRNIESFFKELVAFAKGLSAEEQRTMTENLSEEELAIFDILTRPEPPLTDKEREAVKKVAREMIAKLKAERLVIDWRQKSQARAAVQQMIANYYRDLPSPPYTKEIKQRKRELTFGHIYDNYAGAGRSVYQMANL